MPRLLLTAGPTREPIDSVRFIGNRSSGRIGLAIAAAADAAGWTVTLLLGPGPQAPSEPIDTIRFETTAELDTLLHEHWPNHDVLIMAAAVADERPADQPADGKQARGDARTLQLEPTPDLLAGLAPITRSGQYRVGFALEPATQLLERAKAKLKNKCLDAIVANPLSTMDATTIDATLLLANGDTVPAPECMEKSAFAIWLIEHLTSQLPAST